jgi:hypothetical protein
VFPEAKLLFPLRARSASATDKYRKIHSPYAQSVFEMIRSSGLPAPLRRLAPLLENGDGEILWVCGSPVAAPFAMDGPSSGPFVQVAVTP